MATALADRIAGDRAARTAAVPAGPGRGRIVLTVIGAVFFALGWALGAVVSIVKYALGAMRYGYRQGRLLVPDPPRPEVQPSG